MELEASKEGEVGQQGRVTAVFLFLTPEEKAATAVQVKRSLSDPRALSMLAQSVVVAEAESRQCHKEHEKRKAQGKGAMAELAAPSHIGQVWEAQWERDNPEELFFDCHVVTLEAESEGKAVMWHEVQQMAEEDVPAQNRWEVEKHGEARQLKQAVGQEAEQQQTVQQQEVQMSAQVGLEERKRQEEQKGWAKVQLAAQEAVEPQDKRRRAFRKLLNKIQSWGTQAQGRQWEQPRGIWWHMQQEERALSWVYGGVEAEVKAFLTPELQQPGGDRRLYMAAKEAAREAARNTTWPAMLLAGVDVQEATDAMEEHMALLCKEAVGTVAAATENGAQEGLKEAVKNIAQLVAAESKAGLVCVEKSLSISTNTP